jgi:hydroxymethylbilane synthase
MMRSLKIGTRESELAVWQATKVQTLLKKQSVESELVFINSEGDVDLVTPLYEMGVQGIFTKTLDIALLTKRIDIAVHSMKDVPTQLPQGIKQAAVLKRGSYKDILVLHPDLSERKAMVIVKHISITSYNSKDKQSEWTLPLREHPDKPGEPEDIVIATSSIRRIAQWLNHYPHHKIVNLRGNVNTRLRKLRESNWHGAIFAAAGLERLNLRPENSIELDDWMLPAPAQGAIMVVCREDDLISFEACQNFNDSDTALCTKVERDFLRTLLGGCSTPISALARIRKDKITLKGNICSVDGKELISVAHRSTKEDSDHLGTDAANLLLKDTRVKNIMQTIRNEKS